MKKLKKYIRRLFYDYKWEIGYRKINDENFSLPKTSDTFDYKLLKVENGYWAADPFIYSKNGESYLFFEYTCVKKYKSVLAVKKIFPIEDDIHIIYEFEGHTSYPCIFEWNNKMYIIPETISSTSVQLLECKKWPYIWEIKHNIIENFHAVDTTILKHNGKLLFITYNIPNNKNNERNLYLGELDIYSLKLKNLQKVVEYHTENGRPGGHFIDNNGILIRVIQPGVNFYGEKIEFFKVEIQNGKYSEEKISELLPNQIKTDSQIDIVGIHTYNRNNNYEVIDIRVDYKFDVFKPVKRIFQIFELFDYGLGDQRHKYMNNGLPAHLTNLK